jgi:hypothetical protein
MDQLFIRKVMTKKRRKDDIRLPLVKYHLPVIRMHPFCMTAPPSFPGHRNTMRIVVDTDHFYVDTPPVAIPAQYPQIVAAATPDLTDRYPLTPSQQPLQPPDADPVSPQPGIDGIQFMHIPLYIRKRNIVPVEQLFLGAPFGITDFHANLFLR